MFMDTSVRPQGEKPQVRKLKLSEAIKLGRPLVVEGRDWYGCALCAACHATGFPLHVNGPIRYTDSEVIFQHLAAKTLASVELLETISRRHFEGESSASLVSWLEAQGL